MANAANAVWVNQGPAFNFQQMALGGTDMKELAYRGKVTLTGDAATSTITVNFIDGTQTPFFTPGNPPTAVAPSMVLCQFNSGGVTATVNILGVTSITTTGFVITLEANLPATAFTIAFIVFA